MMCAACGVVAPRHEAARPPRGRIPAGVVFMLADADPATLWSVLMAVVTTVGATLAGWFAWKQRHGEISLKATEVKVEADTSSAPRPDETA